MSVSSSEQMVGYQYVEIIQTKSLFMEAEFQELKKARTQWGLLEAKIMEAQQSIIHVEGEGTINKTVEKEGITVGLGDQISLVKFSKDGDQDRSNEKYEKLLAEMTEKIEGLNFIIAEQKTEIKVLASQVEMKTLEIEKITATNGLNESKARKEILRFENENRLLIQQITKLNIDRNEPDEAISEENSHLRGMIEGLNKEIMTLTVQNTTLLKERKTNTSSTYQDAAETINLKNKLSSLETTNRILENQNDKLKKQVLSKDYQIKTLHTQIRTLKIESPTKVTGRYKTEESPLGPGEGSSKIVAHLQKQIRQLQRRLDDEKKDKLIILQKHQLETTKMTSDYKLLFDQKTSLQRELTTTKSTTSLHGNFNSYEYEKKIMELETQIVQLKNDKNTSQFSANNSYVSKNSYQMLRESIDKERKAFNEHKDKLKGEINQLKMTNNQLVQDISISKNERQRLDSDFSRAELEITKLEKELQKAKKQNDELTRKIKYQENDVNNFRGSKSYETSPRNTDRDNYQYVDEIRVLKEQNDSMKKAIMEYKHLLNNRNLTAMNDKMHYYETQLRDKSAYIKTLISDMRDKDDRINTLEDELQRIRNLGESNSSGDSATWANYHGQLNFSNKMTEKLSEHVKQLKIQKSNLETELRDKEKLIKVLNIRISELSNSKITSAGKIEYNDLLTFSKDKNKPNGKLTDSFISVTNNADDLREQIDIYKNKYEKALETSNYLRQCLHETKKNPAACSLCLEYQSLVVELQRRINIYEVVVVGELRKMFMTCEARLGETDYTWLQIENIIYDLRSRTLNHKLTYETASERNSPKHRVAESPLSARVVMEKSPKSFMRSDRRLDDLIKSDRLSAECISVLMLRIAEGVAAKDNLKFVLPDCIYVLYLNTNNPQKMKVEFIEKKELLEESHKVYLAPEVVAGGEHTEKSLVWNLGVIFNLLINKKNYFSSVYEVLNKTKIFRFENRDMGEFKYLLEGMLERDATRRLWLDKVKSMLLNLVIADGR